jgi:thiol-disulfide isomerase/thioredoxin
MTTRVRLAAVCITLIALSGCHGAGNKGSTAGYVSADGQITRVKIADRKAAPTLAGDDLDGRPVSSEKYAGEILVVNVWGSWCGPCNKEAPTFAKVSKAYASKNVQFLGIDVRDDPASGQSFNRKFGITYPSIDDSAGRTLLGFAKSLPSQAIPTTWIIDAKGRVAVRIMIDGLTAATLTGLIDDVQKSTA